MYKLIIKKKKIKLFKIVFLAKTKLNSIEAVRYKALADPCIGNDEFVIVNNTFKCMVIWEKKIESL